METPSNNDPPQVAKPAPYDEVRPVTTAGLRAAKAVARDEGISDVTIWRRVMLGWLTAVNIAGRPYITSESLAEFYRRAAAGEFAKPPAGAARRSAQARAEKESAGQLQNDELVAMARDFLAKRRGKQDGADSS